MFESLYDVCDAGKYYMEALLYDYSNFLKFHNYVDINIFIKNWNILSDNDMLSLKIGDSFYSNGGNQYTCIEEPYEINDDTCAEPTIVTVASTKNNTKPQSTVMIQSGYAYASFYKNKFEAVMPTIDRTNKGGIKLWPPLIITKTKTHQN